MKTVAIIPARLESSRFPKKLLYLIDKKSILQRTYENAKQCSSLDEVFIATDHPTIRDVAASFQAKVIMTGPCNSGTERIAEAVSKTQALNNCKYIINIQGDHPVLSSDTISSLVEMLDSDKKACMSTAVIELKDRKKAKLPNIVKCVLDQNQQALYFSRLPIPFASDAIYQHLGVYAFQKDFLLKIPTLKDTPLQLAEDLEQLKILEHGYKIKVAIVKDVDISIDILDDIALFKTHLQNASWEKS